MTSLLKGTHVALVFSGPCSDHSFLIDQSGAIFGFGLNDKGQLGLGYTSEYSKPTVLPSFDVETVGKVACGEKHTILLTNRGEIYMFGSNEFLQAHGAPTQSCNPEPTQNSYFQEKADINEHIVDIGCGSRTSFYVSEEGRVWNSGYVLHMRKEEQNPILVPFPDDIHVASISVGWEHIAALTTEGKVYTWGSNRSFELGRDDDCLIPHEVKFEGSGTLIMGVRCGVHHVIACSREGTVYGWGFNFRGQLGVGHTEKEKYPVVIPLNIDGKKVTWLSVGGSHTFFSAESVEELDSQNETIVRPKAPYFRIETVTKNIFCFGSNDQGQISPSKTVANCSPISFAFEGVLLDETASVVVLGRRHTLILTSIGACYVIGAYNGVSNGKPRIISDNVLQLSSTVRNDVLDEVIRSQGESEHHRTTDTCIELLKSDGKVLSVVEVNSEYVRLRLPSMNLKGVVSGDEITQVVVIQFLAALYGGSMNTVDMSSTEISTLNEILCTFNLNERVRRGRNVLSSDFASSSGVITSGFQKIMEILLKEKNEKGDVVICSLGDTHRAHKFVLAARSPYFNTLFHGGWLKESKQISAEVPLGKPFESFLAFLYTGRLSMNDEDAFYVLQYASYFGIRHRDEEEYLKKSCVGRIRSFSRDYQKFARLQLEMIEKFVGCRNTC